MYGQQSTGASIATMTVPSTEAISSARSSIGCTAASIRVHRNVSGDSPSSQAIPLLLVAFHARSRPINVATTHVLAVCSGRRLPDDMKTLPRDANSDDRRSRLPLIAHNRAQQRQRGGCPGPRSAHGLLDGWIPTSSRRDACCLLWIALSVHACTLPKAHRQISLNTMEILDRCRRGVR